jgi:uncharacterized membrane protein YesL
MEMRGLMGGFYRISEWIMRLSAINLLWIICSLPFFVLIFSQMFVISQQEEIVITTTYDLLGYLLIPMILAPFTLFPATAAMFAVARKWIMGDEDVPLLRTFFRNFKATYKASMFGGIFYNFLLIVLLINLQFYSERNTALAVLTYLFIVLMVILGASAINFFSFVSHFEMTTWSLIKNSVFFTIGRPLTTIYILMVNSVILYVSLFKFPFLIPFFMGSLIAIASFWSFYRVVRKIQEKAEEEAKEVTQEEA